MSDQKPETVQHVSEQEFIAACEQDGCARKARGTIPALGEHGWVMMPPEQAGQFERREPVWFCPGCVLGLRPAP